jgi:hypothetical protein
MQTMRSDTQTTSIDTTADAVMSFLADGANLPRWAIGFANAVRPDGDRWIVTTGEAEVPTTITAHAAARTVDYQMEPEPGHLSTAYIRVVPNGDGAEVVFTQFQAPGMTDEMFGLLVTAVGHELVTLKAALEVECPL